MSVKMTPARYEIVLDEAEYSTIRLVVQDYANLVAGSYLFDHAKVAAEALGLELVHDTGGY